MTAELTSFERLESFFHQARALDAAQRSAFVAAVAEEDPALGDELRDLLTADAAAEGFLVPGAPLGLALTGALHLDTTRGPDAHTAQLCRPALELEPESPVSQRIAGRYRIEALLGSGGAASVYRATDEHARRSVAVKVLHPLAEASLGTLRQEVGLLRLLRLPGVVHMLGEGVDEAGRPFIVTELIEGRPFPGRPGPQPWEALERPVVAFLDALARVHALGIVHRDLKPANVLVDAEGQPTILDLGIARTKEQTPAEREEAVVGTLSYMAPEQLECVLATVRSDLYAVGLMLYQALAGRAAHPARSVAELVQRRQRGAHLPLDSLAPETPPRVLELVRRLLRLDPARRPASALEALALLGELPDGAAGRLPYLGRGEVLARLEEAAGAGRSLDLGGGPGAGRSRCLRELEARLRAAGRQVCWATPGEAPFAGLTSGEDPAAREAALGEALRGGLVVLVDEPAALDAASAELLERARAVGSVIRAVEGPGELSLSPLEEADLRPLFAGPDRVLHLREDGARELWRRTGGWPARLVPELDAWVRSGLAHWSEDRVVVQRPALDRLRGGLWPSTWPAPPGRRPAAELPAELRVLLATVQAAGAFATVELVAGASGRPRAQLEEELGRLEQEGFLARLPEDRLVPRDLPGDQRAEAELTRGLALQGLVAALPPGSEARLFFLVAAGRLQEVAQEALALAERRARAGDLGRAVAAVTEGLIAARRARDEDAELALLELRLHLAFAHGTPGALDQALSELARTPREDECIRRLEDLGRGAVLAAERDIDGALRSLEGSRGLPPRLERWRHSARLRALRCGPHGAAEVQALAEAAGWAAEHAPADPDLAGAAASWTGWVRYRQGRYREAAANHAAAAERASYRLHRVAARLDAASAFLEAGDLDEALELARRAGSEAARSRHPRLEARAEWLMRAARYRRGDSLRADSELGEASARLGAPSLEALICLSEAAIAWRARDLAAGRALAAAATAAWELVGNETGATLANALELACGGEAGSDELEALATRAVDSSVGGVGAQALGLLALRFPQRRPAWRPLWERLEARLAPHDPLVRAEVLSTAEVRAAFEPQSAAQEEQT